MTLRATIKDVALKAGVTHPTVSRVIHDHPRISEATKRRVRKAMKALNYQPNRLARSLIQRKSQIIACIIPDLNPHVQPILRGITDICMHNQYGLMMFSANYWTKEKISYMQVANTWQVDGMLIYNVVYHDTNTENIRFLLSQDTPMVFINKYLNEKKAFSVGTDNFESIAQAVRHLAELGHKRIGLMNGNLKSVDGAERNLAFKSAIQDIGLPYDKALIGCANFSDTEAEEECTRLIQTAHPPSALICANDLMALGSISAIRKSGLRVPEDIAVVGFDDIDASRWSTPSLSTLRPSLREIGERAADLLIERIEHPDIAPVQIAIPSKLIVRSSSGTAVTSSTP